MTENNLPKRKRPKDMSVLGQLKEAVTTLSSGKVNGKKDQAERIRALCAEDV